MELGANVECIFRVKFFQENGLQLNFSRLQEAYNYEFITDPPQSLKTHSLNQASVTFIRDYIGDDPISLRIKLDDRATRETYLSNEVIIPSSQIYAEPIALYARATADLKIASASTSAIE